MLYMDSTTSMMHPVKLHCNERLRWILCQQQKLLDVQTEWVRGLVAKNFESKVSGIITPVVFDTFKAEDTLQNYPNYEKGGIIFSRYFWQLKNWIHSFNECEKQVITDYKIYHLNWKHQTPLKTRASLYYVFLGSLFSSHNANSRFLCRRAKITMCNQLLLVQTRTD